MEGEPGSPNPAAGAGEGARPAQMPARVWLSRLGTGQGEIEGTLSLTAAELRFDHRRGMDHERVPLTAVHKVKRPLGSPVLYVEYARGPEPVRLAFFFAQPPPIDSDVSRVRARRKRSDSAGFMWQQSGDVAALARAWRDAVREAVKRAKSLSSE
jgi:hypothetical protein